VRREASVTEAAEASGVDDRCTASRGGFGLVAVSAKVVEGVAGVAEAKCGRRFCEDG
jgi:hypothetical protein